MRRWAIRMPRDSVPALALLRLLPAIEGALVGEEIWLRGDALRDDDEGLLRAVPGAERFEVNDEAELIPLGGRVPTGYLPGVAWQPLSEFARPALPLAPLASSTPALEPLVLAVDDVERPIAALLTSLASWAAYADCAPLVRLSRLSFLASSDNRVLIVGTPLPPLAGVRYWEAEGCYVAAGFHWQPAIDPLLVRRALRLDDNELAIWHADGSWERASRDDLVLARRGAVRATAEGAPHGH